MMHGLSVSSIYMCIDLKTQLNILSVESYLNSDNYNIHLKYIECEKRDEWKTKLVDIILFK